MGVSALPHTIVHQLATTPVPAQRASFRRPARARDPPRCFSSREGRQGRDARDMEAPRQRTPASSQHSPRPRTLLTARAVASPSTSSPALEPRKRRQLGKRSVPATPLNLFAAARPPPPPAQPSASLSTTSAKQRVFRGVGVAVRPLQASSRRRATSQHNAAPRAASWARCGLRAPCRRARLAARSRIHAWCAWTRRRKAWGEVTQVEWGGLERGARGDWMPRQRALLVRIGTSAVCADTRVPPAPVRSLAHARPAPARAHERARRHLLAAAEARAPCACLAAAPCVAATRPRPPRLHHLRRRAPSGGRRRTEAATTYARWATR